jgi:pSer/pThr/pTyr-binding forkhead associated (FHA) protein
LPEIVYVTLRYLFLALLFAFVFAVARSVYREMEPAPRPGAEKAAAKKAKAKAKGKASLVIPSPAGRRRQAGWELGEEMIIGRSPECGISLDDEFASNLHAKIYQLEGRFYIEDLGSTNGTYVNGRRINYPTELRGGDNIKIGRTAMEFRR